MHARPDAVSRLGFYFWGDMHRLVSKGGRRFESPKWSLCTAMERVLCSPASVRALVFSSVRTRVIIMDHRDLEEKLHENRYRCAVASLMLSGASSIGFVEIVGEFLFVLFRGMSRSHLRRVANIPVPCFFSL